MKSKVVNLKHSPYEVYIGRAGKGKSGYFGNPYRIGIGEQRGATILKYKQYFYQRLKSDQDFKNKIQALNGKVLGCFCKPKACHGDVIVEYLDFIEWAHS